MSFSPGDSVKYKKGLSSSGAQSRWSSIANKVLSETGSESKAIRMANATSKGSSPFNRDSVARKLRRLGHPSN